jgi:hypothetical protein
VRPATLWGTEPHLRELFADRVDWISLTKRHYGFRYHSPEHFSEWFRRFYGPITSTAHLHTGSWCAHARIGGVMSRDMCQGHVPGHVSQWVDHVE